MAWFHVTLSLRDAPSSSVESSFDPLASGDERTSRFPAGLSRDRTFHFFQDHDGDLLRVQPADPESSGRADMAGRQWLGRPRTGTSGGIDPEATTGYAETRFQLVQPAFFARKRIMEIVLNFLTVQTFDSFP